MIYYQALCIIGDKVYGLVGDSMVYLPDYAIPVIPQSERLTLNTAAWEIKNDKYMGRNISCVTQAISDCCNPTKNFLMVDGYYITEKGLWLSVPNGIKCAESGLWFFTAGLGRIRRVADYGRVIPNP